MPNPVLTTPTVTWQNDVNNWRAEDGHWLESRSVLRFATEAERNLPANTAYKGAGSLNFIANAGAGYFVAQTSSAAGDVKRVFLANNLSVATDTTTQINLKTLNGTVSLQLEDNKISIAGMTTNSEFNAGRLRATNTQVGIVSSTDGSVIGLTKEGASLVVGGPLRINNATEVVTGGFTVTAGATKVKSLEADSLNVLGTAVASTFSTTVGGSPATGAFNGPLVGNVTSTSSTFGTGTSMLTIANSSVTNLAGATPNQVEIRNDGITLKTQGTMRTKLQDNTSTSLAAQVATVIFDSRTPAAAGNPDYPDGCLWIQI